jgi:hypothetical protein
MVFSAVRAAILRGSQELAPQDDGGDALRAYSPVSTRTAFAAAEARFSTLILR